jgi:hypothetical protein
MLDILLRGVRVVKQHNLVIKMLYSNSENYLFRPEMAIRFLNRLRGFYIFVWGGVDVEISMHHPLFIIAECIYITNRKQYCRNIEWT